MRSIAEKKAIKKLWYENNRDRVIQRNAQYRLKKRADPYQWAHEALFVARERAGRKNIPFDITATDIDVVLICPVFNIQIEYGGGRNNPRGPSLDRTIPKLGYVKGNVRIISNRANTLKRDATTEEVRQVLKYMENI